MPETAHGKAAALTALRYRREHKPKKIDNASLHAGAPMFYYCISCGALTEVLPEEHASRPKQLCDECHAMKECGWLE